MTPKVSDCFVGLRPPRNASRIAAPCELAMTGRKVIATAGRSRGGKQSEPGIGLSDYISLHIIHIMDNMQG